MTTVFTTVRFRQFPAQPQLSAFVNPGKVRRSNFAVSAGGADGQEVRYHLFRIGRHVGAVSVQGKVVQHLVEATKTIIIRSPDHSETRR